MGVQQGGPVGPAGFCLSTQPLLLSLKFEFNSWYLDDGTLGGTENNVFNDLVMILEAKEDMPWRLIRRNVNSIYAMQPLSKSTSYKKAPMASDGHHNGGGR